jgi:hypothetical protein
MVVMSTLAPSPTISLLAAARRIDGATLSHDGAARHALDETDLRASQFLPRMGGGPQPQRHAVDAVVRRHHPIRLVVNRFRRIDALCNGSFAAVVVVGASPSPAGPDWRWGSSAGTVAASAVS